MLPLLAQLYESIVPTLGVLQLVNTLDDHVFVGIADVCVLHERGTGHLGG